MTIINPIDKILSVATDDDNQCWLWPRPNSYLYRASWEAHNAMPVPPGMVVRHICDQSRCLNPFHLTIGTQSENAVDRVNRTPGIRRGSYLSDAEKLTIMTSAASTPELSTEFKVSERLINIIRQRWSNFTELQREAYVLKVKAS